MSTARTKLGFLRRITVAVLLMLALLSGVVEFPSRSSTTPHLAQGHTMVRLKLQKSL